MMFANFAVQLSFYTFAPLWQADLFIVQPADFKSY
jgi:hypothetical protein